ncbi:MAG: AMP-binding protein [bacterium]|nr:AMP-binding protein [bacterium]MDE0353173.1 AMP-binding protein [bacterium]
MNSEVERERQAIGAAIGDMTLVGLLGRNAERFGDHPAIRWNAGEETRTLTWSEYRGQVVEVAAGLRTLGVEAGNFVAIMAGNRPEHVIADLGIVHAGAVPVSLYNTLAGEQIQYIADHCSARVAVLENADYLGRWQGILGDLPNLTHIVVMEPPEDGDDERIMSWEALRSAGREALAADPELVERSSVAVAQDDLATLIYTSGTTGVPKGVMISHRNVMWTLECVSRTYSLPDHLRLVSYLPLAHIGERMASHYVSLYWVGTVRYIPDLTEVAAAVQETRPHVFFAVPRVWEKFHAGLMARVNAEPNARRRALALGAIELAIEGQRAEQEGRHLGLGARLKLKLFDRILFSKKFRTGLGMDALKVAISAAAPISPDLLLFFRGIGLPVFELYGMTESSGPGTSNVPGANRIGTVGRAMPGVELSIADDDEIMLRGGLITEGYYRDPDTTAATYGEDGWLRTGDLGRLDDHGYLSIIGRKKEIIITAGGKNVAPARLENLINEHALISQACVVGDGRRYLTLLLALDPDMAEGWAESQGVEYGSFDEFTRHSKVLAEVDRLVESANARVARVEQARKWTVVSEKWSAESGELTPSLKMKRRVVLERYSRQIEDLYED